MKGRKATPNIMEELLNIKVSSSSNDINSKDSIPENHNTSTPEPYITGIPENHNTILSTHQPASIPAQNRGIDKTSEGDRSLEEDKAKATYYISQKVIEDIDQVWFDLRKLLKPADRGKFSKSLLVELAVKAAVEDFRKNPEASNLLQRILNIGEKL